MVFHIKNYLHFHSCTTFPVLLFLLPCLYFALPHFSQMYIIFVFFVVLDFLLFFVIGGLLPHFPLFPMPLPRPLNLALYFDPLVRVPLWKPVPTSFIFCFVFELQYGQKRLTVFGIFITYERKRWFLKFKLGRMALP